METHHAPSEFFEPIYKLLPCLTEKESVNHHQDFVFTLLYFEIQNRMPPCPTKAYLTISNPR